MKECMPTENKGNDIVYNWKNNSHKAFQLGSRDEALHNSYNISDHRPLDTPLSGWYTVAQMG